MKAQKKDTQAEKDRKKKLAQSRNGSISKYCHDMGICRQTHYSMVKAGVAPAVQHVLGRRIITQAAIAAWEAEYSTPEGKAKMAAAMKQLAAARGERHV